MARNLVINLQGPVDPVAGDEVRLAAAGMEGGGWRYMWHVHDARGHEVGGLTHRRGDKHEVVNWRAPESPGVYTIQVVARRKAEAVTHRTEISLDVGGGRLERQIT
jgi:hypothetical protein